MLEISSESSPVNVPGDSIPALASFLEDFRSKRFLESETVFLLGHSFDAVRIGVFIKDQLVIQSPLDPRHLQDLRMFSDTSELHIWSWSGALRGRIRKDRDGGLSTPVQEVYHAVWGRGFIAMQDGWWALKEDRVSDILLPFEPVLPLLYKVRNYFEFDAHGLARCVDARLCGFCDKKHNRIECR